MQAVASSANIAGGANITGGVAGGGVNSANIAGGANSTDGEAGSGFAGVKKSRRKTIKDFYRSFFSFYQFFFARFLSAFFKLTIFTGLSRFLFLQNQRHQEFF